MWSDFMKGKLSAIFKTAAFPAVMTLISFVLFIAVYLFVTVTAVEPYYFAGLLFLVPSVCFGIITYFTVSGKLKTAASSGITAAAILVLGVASLVGFSVLSFQAATTTTTDTRSYGRVLRLSNYPENALISCFPERIPEDAKDVVFRYHPAILQGGENYELKFKADSDFLKRKAEEFARKSKWTGKMSDREAEKHGVISGSLGELGYYDLPDDFTVYLMNGEPYQPNDWNHGKVSLVAVNRKSNEIIFHAEDW